MPRAETPLRINQNCEYEWVSAHASPTGGKRCRDHDLITQTIKLRRIGWIDQKGNVWTDSGEWIAAGGPNGSITPLYINPGC